MTDRDGFVGTAGGAWSSLGYRALRRRPVPYFISNHLAHGTIRVIALEMERLEVKVPCANAASRQTGEAKT
jgi:hypothetical protein